MEFTSQISIRYLTHITSKQMRKETIPSPTRINSSSTILLVTMYELTTNLWPTYWNRHSSNPDIHTHAGMGSELVNIHRMSMYTYVVAPPPFICSKKGGLNPTSQPESRVNSEVIPPKAITILKWVTFLALDLWGTLPPRVHPIMEGVSRWTRYFQSTMWERRGLPLVKIGAGCFVHTCSSRSLQMETIVLGAGGGGSNSCKVCFRIIYRLNKLENEATS